MDVVWQPTKYCKVVPVGNRSVYECVRSASENGRILFHHGAVLASPPKKDADGVQDSWRDQNCSKKMRQRFEIMSAVHLVAVAFASPSFCFRRRGLKR